MEVRFKELNGSVFAAKTDNQGRFLVRVPEANRAYMLYAQDPRFGPVLQSTFGRVILIHSLGQQNRDVIVPAIPATELSGHTYDESGTPIEGCPVWAMTHPAGRSLGPATELDEVAIERTDDAGAFTFRRLGSDRYFLVARCHRYLPDEQRAYAEFVDPPWRVRSSWQTTVLGAILLLPGDRRSFDFHLRATPQYSIHGRVRLSISAVPQASHSFQEKIQLVPLDPARTAIAVDGEACNWKVKDTAFHCDFLSPGIYRLSFTLTEFGPQGNVVDTSPQSAEVYLEARAEKRVAPEIVVQLHDTPQPVTTSPSPLKTGLLQLKRVCPVALTEGWAVETKAWGQTNQYLRSWSLNCIDKKLWKVPVGTYNIAAYQNEFFGKTSNLPYFLHQQGSPVIVRNGLTTKLAVPVRTTDDIIRIALKALQ